MSGANFDAEAETSFDSELSGETLGNLETPTLGATLPLPADGLEVQRTPTHRSLSLRSRKPPPSLDDEQPASLDSTSLSIMTPNETEIETENDDDQDQAYFTAESNSAPSLPSTEDENDDFDAADELELGMHIFSVTFIDKI